MPVTDIVNLAGVILSLGTYAAINLTGHSAPDANQALLTLAAFFGGSHVRGQLPNKGQ